MIARRPSPDRPRRGVVALETLLLLPVLLLVVAGMVGLTDLIMAEQKLDRASGAAARVAAGGGSDEDIERAVHATLGEKQARHAKIYVSREDENGRPIPQGGMIEVRVEIQARHATATPLAPIRPSEPLIGRTVMPRE